MITKYRANLSLIGIKKFDDIVRETDASIFRKYGLENKPRRFAKKTTYEVWFDTYEEAKEAIVADRAKKVAHAQARVNYAMESLDEAMEL